MASTCSDDDTRTHDNNGLSSGAFEASRADRGLQSGAHTETESRLRIRGRDRFRLVRVRCAIVDPRGPWARVGSPWGAQPMRPS